MIPMKTTNSPENIDDYLENFPPQIQEILKELRSTIKRAAPDADEKISYQMPTFYQKGNLVHFAAYKNHIGFYPAPSAILLFKNELSEYKNAKGSIQFPLDKPLPLDLITRIVTFRVNENIKKAELKTKKSRKTKI